MRPIGREEVKNAYVTKEERGESDGEGRGGLLIIIIKLRI
jgi:hypothetical protein